jgi:hypothetical protein
MGWSSPTSGPALRFLRLRAGPSLRRTTSTRSTILVRCPRSSVASRNQTADALAIQVRGEPRSIAAPRPSRRGVARRLWRAGPAHARTGAHGRWPDAPVATRAGPPVGAATKRNDLRCVEVVDRDDDDRRGIAEAAVRRSSQTLRAGPVATDRGCGFVDHQMGASPGGSAWMPRLRTRGRTRRARDRRTTRRGERRHRAGLCDHHRYRSLETRRDSTGGDAAHQGPRPLLCDTRVVAVEHARDVVGTTLTYRRGTPWPTTLQRSLIHSELHGQGALA